MARLAEDELRLVEAGRTQMYQVYVLKSLSASKSYVGVTDNLERRIKEHNSSKNFYTKRHVPWIVIYTECYAQFTDARSGEKYLKSTAGRRFLKKLFS